MVIEKLKYRDLAPGIHRQRLVIEGVQKNKIDEFQIKDYLTKLGKVINMQVLTSPTTHESLMYGWAGWVHWETSGAHFYAWERLEDETPISFFSVDIYACKSFRIEHAVEFTKEMFQVSEIVWKCF